jgi:hypothetical protein
LIEISPKVSERAKLYTYTPIPLALPAAFLEKENNEVCQQGF